ncbi:PPOX class F420-dependent oxidoreductase [Rhodococcus sp. X156]|uniref:PPOX class F420-dependent oxidoreductase n=1 Tax=Rhodococcus sp. X156 TaxID=2499145 RepID=UPI000FDB58E0|nr:PPOX class F420-dependent oxidoreductase [Rhodococcus sp. X156]
MPSTSPAALPAVALEFLAERQLASLTTLRADGTPHVVPVGFTWDAERSIARIITRGGSLKARNAARGGRGSLCQVDWARWMTLEGVTSVHTDAEEVAEGERRYAQRYRQPRPNPERVVIQIAADRVLGSASLLHPE